MTVSKQVHRTFWISTAIFSALTIALPTIAAASRARPGVSLVAARSASSASRSSAYQTRSNSARYRRSKNKEASRNRAKLRRATRSRYRRDHQPGGYCIYDTKGNVILKPDGVECQGQDGDYMQASGGSAGPARAAATSGRTGCVTGSCRQGEGTYVWKSGAHYTGVFHSGRQHGQGLLVMPDGSSYSGEWANGKKEGSGVATFADGRVQTGYWKDNKYVGTSRARRLNIRWPDLSKATPKRIGGGEKDAAVVVGVTHYAHVADIEGATDNATDWYGYLVKNRKVPVDRVSLLLDEDATVEEMRIATKEAAKRVKKGGTLWFVFVGHGAPAKDGRDGLLVGFDAQQKARSIESRSLRRSELLAALEDSRAKNIQVLLDACFSGKTGSGQQLVAGLQPLVVTSLAGHQDPRTTVLTAAGSDEYAGPLPGASRPAFSYLALGGLRGWADSDRNGKITSGELHGYVTNTMRALVRDRRQRPTLLGSTDARFGKSGREVGPDIASLVVSSARR